MDSCLRLACEFPDVFCSGVIAATTTYLTHLALFSHIHGRVICEYLHLNVDIELKVGASHWILSTNRACKLVMGDVYMYITCMLGWDPRKSVSTTSLKYDGDLIICSTYICKMKMIHNRTVNERSLRCPCQRAIYIHQCRLEYARQRIIRSSLA